MPSPLKLARPAVVRCLPFLVFMLVLALRGLLEGRMDTRWLYGLQAGLAVLVLAVWWREYGELHPGPAAPGGASMRLAVVTGLLVFAAWMLLQAPWMHLGEPVAGFVPVAADGRLQWPLIIVRLLGACLVVPVMEELFWRSFLMRWIDRRNFLGLAPQEVSAFALWLSAAAFALAHDLWLAGLVAGLMFGALYRHTGRLWHAIVAHAVANFALGLWVVTRREWVLW